MEMCGDLSEEIVSGSVGLGSEEGGGVWKNVGIWTQAQWNILVRKGLTSLSKRLCLCCSHDKSQLFKVFKRDLCVHVE